MLTDQVLIHVKNFTCSLPLRSTAQKSYKHVRLETNFTQTWFRIHVDNVAAKELLLREVLMLDGEFGKHVGFYFPG